MGVATNRVYKDRNGQRQESTEFHNVVVFGNQAENSAQYLRKGQQVLVEGRLQTRSWDDQTSGQKKYRTEIVADMVQFGSRGGEAGGQNSAYADNQAEQKGSGPSDTGVTGQTTASTSPEAGNSSPADEIDYPEEEINPEDIPF